MKIEHESWFCFHNKVQPKNDCLQGKLLLTKKTPHLFYKNPVSFAFLGFVNLEREYLFAVLKFLLYSTKLLLYILKRLFKLVVVIYCGSSGVTKTKFPLISNLFPILFTAYFTYSIFKVANIHLSVIFFSLNRGIWFFNCSPRCYLSFLGIVFNT